jgi:L-lactate dehydrogenase complex protein LldF
VRIDIPRMLVELRREVDERHIAPWPERMFFRSVAAVFARPGLYRLAVPLARLLQRPFVRDGALRRLPRDLGGWTRTRDLPAVAARTFTERWPELAREAAPR